MEFFANLNFTSSNEDGDSEIAALKGAQHIIALTGTGTRILDLLMTDAEEVVALDANPAQNALLALKMAAIEACDYHDYLGFIGIADDDRRMERYASLRSHLSPEASAYWDHHSKAIRSGLWHVGKWEKLLRWNARFIALTRSRAVDTLMAAATVEDQADIWRKNFKASRLRKLIEMIGRDWVWRWVMREPAGAFLPNPQAVGDRLDEDFAKAANSFLFRQSDIATLVLRGKHRAGGALPVHLRAENYDRIRSALPRLRIVQAGLADLNRLDIGPYDGFSLSDFGSYCGVEDYAACWRGIVAAAKPGARYCERIFMNPMDIPFPNVTIDEALSRTLSASDKSIIYRIRAGTIGANP